MTDMFWLAWAAGIVDGEGAIVVRKQRSEKGRPNGKWVHALRVANTDPRMVLRLKELFGGSVQGPRLLRLSTKPAYEWQATGALAASVLRAIRPWLVIKGEQADLAIRFAETMIYNHYGGNRRLPQHVETAREAMVLELQELRSRRTG